MPLSLKTEKELISQVACDLLVNCNCDKLPTELDRVLYYLDNIVICKAKNIHKYFEIWDDEIPQYGLLIRSMLSDKYLILANDDTYTQYIYAVALGLSYIQLNYLDSGEVCYISDDDEAMLEFAEYLMAPDPILKECSILDSKTLMQLTCLSFKSSLHKERRLRTTVSKRITAIEKLLLQNFMDYIDKVKSIFS